MEKGIEMWKIEIYRDNGAHWRWRLRAANGAIVAGSQESFYSRANAVRAAANARDGMVGAKMVEAPDATAVLARALALAAQRDASRESTLAELLRAG